MLKDSEIKEICRMMERLSRYDDSLLRMAVHTENAEREGILCARYAIVTAFGHLSRIAKPGEEMNG